MSINQPDFERLQRAVIGTVREHWVLFLVEGIVLVLLGLLAIMVPLVASLAVAIVVGWLFLFSGVFGLITTFWMRQLPGFWWSLISAVIAIGAGVVLLGRPASGVLTLTLVLIVFFLIEGIASIMFALEHRKQLSGRSGWMLISGVVDLILAAIILMGLPGTAEWAIGLIVGINMLFGGTSMIAMALHARASEPTPVPTPSPPTSQPRSA
jgi:uncharacterized membrane protein HdeD (DUF308 family)